LYNDVCSINEVLHVYDLPEGLPKRIPDGSTVIVMDLSLPSTKYQRSNPLSQIDFLDEFLNSGKNDLGNFFFLGCRYMY
jgi:hypothetical protein